MVINLTPEQEARIQELAAQSGRQTHQVVEDVITRYFRDQDELAASVEEACAAIDRGEYLEHDEVVERIERRFRP